MKTLLKTGFLLLFLAYYTFTNAQVISSIINQNTSLTDIEKPTCGSHDLMKQINNDADGYLDLSEDMMINITEAVSHQMHDRADGDLYVIPVVFHVLYNNNDQNIADSVIFKQLEILNDCFRRRNSDTSDTRTEFLDLVGDAKIEFKLAELDPFGTPTNGIVRTNTSVSHFGGILPYGSGQTQDISNWIQDSLYYNYFRMTQTSLGGHDAWDDERYLNIWIGDLRIFEPQLGNFEELIFFALATPPIDHINWPDSVLQEINTYSQGVLMHYVSIGNNNPNLFPSPYNVYNGIANTGKTLVHEVGHYLGLRHIWGDGDCTYDDFIMDTPNSNAPSNYDCNQSANACVDNINGMDLHNMIENYMDYSSGACQNSFTIGQIDVMRAVLDEYRIDLSEVISTVGLSNNVSSESFSLYPNPSSGEVFIDLGEFNDKAVVIVQNSNGQVIFEETFQEMSKIKIDLDVAQGLYFVQVSVNSSRISNFKLVIE